MADNLDASAAKVLDKLSEGAEAVVAKLGTMAEKYGPEVVDSALWVVRVNGIQELVSRLAIGVFFGAVFYVLARKVAAHIAENKARVAAKGRAFDVTDCDPFVVVFIGGSAAISGVGAAIALIGMTDVWRWVAIFEPKLWVAKRLLGF